MGAPPGAPQERSAGCSDPQPVAEPGEPIAGEQPIDTLAEVADPYLSQRALPHQVKRTLGQLRAVADPELAPSPSPLRPAFVAARAARGRDAAPAAYRRIDCSGRLNVKPLCDVLGWDAGTHVVLSPGVHGYLATATEHRGGRGSLTGTVDGEGRLRLPHAVSAALDPDGCHQVVTRARSDALELYPASLVDDLLDSHNASQSGPSLVPSPTERHQP